MCLCLLSRLKVILIPVLPDPGKNLTQILANGLMEVS